jgi:alpha-L-rhamnosidase
LRRIALTQQPDGQLKAHSCSERFDIHAIMEDRSCDWVVQLREYHESSGDSELVRELWPTLMRLMLWYRQRRTPRGLTLAREWEVWDNPLRYEV